MGYVLATASIPREYIDIDLKVFDSEESLIEHLKKHDVEEPDIQLLLCEGKLMYDEESFAITVS